MGNFNRHNRSGSGRSYGSRDFSRPSFGGQRNDREMHKAVCSSCGKDCYLPFEPNGKKPVYCNDCFRRNGGGTDSRSFPDRNSNRPSFERHQDYGNRPDFERKHEFRPQNNEQFEKLNRKLDKILELISIDAPKIEKKVKTETGDTIVAVPKKIKKPKKEEIITPEANSIL